jgi:ABC-type Co2+ transport system permease subunit
MSQKPGDLFLSVIEFFGILVPGAMFVFLHGNLLLAPWGLSLVSFDKASDWIPAFLVSYVLGHFLLGFSVPLNHLAGRRPSKATRAYLTAARAEVELPPTVPTGDSSVFYAAFSYVRLNSAAAIGEIERQAGEYKLFRSLTLLFVLDLPLAFLEGRLTLLRALVSLLVAGLAYYRFQWLFDWTYRLTCDFYLQMRSAAGVMTRKTK